MYQDAKLQKGMNTLHFNLIKSYRECRNYRLGHHNCCTITKGNVGRDETNEQSDYVNTITQQKPRVPKHNSKPT